MTASKHRQTYDRTEPDRPGTCYGRLTLLRRAPAEHGQVRWVCRCRCGTTVTVSRSNVRRGLTTSCGCWQREQSRAVHLLHGQSDTALYRVWRSMISRCRNRRVSNYKRYGGRGVRVYPPWYQSFAAFADYVGARPSPQHSLDRWPNPNGNYEPGNVRWATLGEQRRNHRINKFISYQGREQLLTDWAHELNMPFSALRQRLRSGWTVAHAFTAPLRPDRRRGPQQP